MPISAPKIGGATAPPISVPTAYTNAIAAARVSSGKISLTVRYAALAPALAKKNIADHQTVRVIASSVLQEQPDRHDHDRAAEDVAAGDHLLAADGVEEVAQDQRAREVGDRERDDVSSDVARLTPKNVVSCRPWLKKTAL